MNPAPVRLLRPLAAHCKSHPAPTDRELKRRTYLIDAARSMFIQHGSAALTMANFALATGVSQIAVKRQFGDLHHIFRLVLSKHLDDVLDDMTAVARHLPNPQAACRAAYFRATRGICSVPTPLHFLLIRERFTLPPDELEGIEMQRRMIGIMLGPEEHIETIITLLDCPTITLEQVEAMVAGLEAYEANPQARPGLAEQPAPEPELVPFSRRREPDPAGMERLKYHLDPRFKPLPALLCDPQPSTDPWANYSDEELRVATDARLPFPLAPPAPRPGWTPTIVQVEDEDEEKPPPPVRPPTH